MKRFKCILPGMVLGVGLGVFSLPENSLANPDFTKQTAKKCVYCHTGNWTSKKSQGTFEGKGASEDLIPRVVTVVDWGRTASSLPPDSARVYSSFDVIPTCPQNCRDR
jgi:hypothetical protein